MKISIPDRRSFVFPNGADSVKYRIEDPVTPKTPNSPYNEAHSLYYQEFSHFPDPSLSSPKITRGLARSNTSHSTRKPLNFSNLRSTNNPSFLKFGTHESRSKSQSQIFRYDGSYGPQKAITKMIDDYVSGRTDQKTYVVSSGPSKSQRMKMPVNYLIQGRQISKGTESSPVSNKRLSIRLSFADRRNESQEKDFSPAWTERNFKPKRNFEQTPTSAKKSFRIKECKKLELPKENMLSIGNKSQTPVDMTMAMLTSQYLVANKNKFKISSKFDKKSSKPSTPSSDIRLFSRLVSSKGFNERFK